jgi:hypothetical protein
VLTSVTVFDRAPPMNENVLVTGPRVTAALAAPPDANDAATSDALTTIHFMLVRLTAVPLRWMDHDSLRY